MPDYAILMIGAVWRAGLDVLEQMLRDMGA